MYYAISSVQLLIQKHCELFGYSDKSVIVTLLTFPNSLTIIDYDCITKEIPCLAYLLPAEDHLLPHGGVLLVGGRLLAVALALLARGGRRLVRLLLLLLALLWANSLQLLSQFQFDNYLAFRPYTGRGIWSKLGFG